MSLNLKPNSYWLVLHEQRPDIVLISPSGNGFFALGQEALWDLSAVSQWLMEIPIQKLFDNIQQDKNFLTPAQCAGQFRNYAENHYSEDSKHSLRFSG